MKYTCQPTENSLDELGIPKNPYSDPSHASVASFWLIPGGGRFMPPPCPDAHIYIPALKGLKVLVRGPSKTFKIIYMLIHTCLLTPTQSYQDDPRGAKGNGVRQSAKEDINANVRRTF